MFNFLFALMMTLLTTISVLAADFRLTANFEGFVDIGNKELYVEYIAPRMNQPTVVLLNGLTYSTVQWTKMVKVLKKTGVGILMYDMDGQGRTLLKYGVKSEPYYYMDQVDDLDNLLQTLEIPRPYNMAGLSYGGGILAAYTAKFPRRIQNAILMAPYTQPVEQQDQWIRSQIWATRQMFPYNSYSDEQLYDFFLKQIVYSTYPMAEPIVLENPYKLEAVFRMTQGIRKYKVIDDVGRFPKNSVHLLVAEQDQYIPRQILITFWDAVPEKAKASYEIAPHSEHKIPEDKPDFAAKYIYNIIKN